MPEAKDGLAWICGAWCRRFRLQLVWSLVQILSEQREDLGEFLARSRNRTGDALFRQCLKER
jgi:hypothetical protein